MAVAALFVAWSDRPGRWRKAVDRLAQAAPILLVGYGAYQALCWLRTLCQSTGGAGTFPLELVFGVALIGVALGMRFAWTLSPSDRVAATLFAVGANRLSLSALGSASVWSSARYSAAVLAVALVLLGVATVRAFRLVHARRRFASERTRWVDCSIDNDWS